jgi:hypothetical protein
LVVGREKDLRFAEALVREELVNVSTLAAHIEALDAVPPVVILTAGDCPSAPRTGQRGGRGPARRHTTDLPVPATLGRSRSAVSVHLTRPNSVR